MVCHNALTAVGGLIGPKAGIAPVAALADFMGNVLPGFQVVPAGVAATQPALQLPRAQGFSNSARDIAL
jgi:hypothetical protein